MDAEIWVTIPEWPEYAASSLGRIKRITAAAGTRPGRIQKPSKQKNGYLYVSFCRNGKKKDMLLHRVIASAFLEFKPGMDVCHFDGNRENCHVTNLRYDTRKGNMADATRHGTLAKGELCSCYSEETILNVKRELANGIHPKECSKKFGIPITTIYGIKDERNWKWLKI